MALGEDELIVPDIRGGSIIAQVYPFEPLGEKVIYQILDGDILAGVFPPQYFSLKEDFSRSVYVDGIESNKIIDARSFTILIGTKTVVFFINFEYFREPENCQSHKMFCGMVIEEPTRDVSGEIVQIERVLAFKPDIGLTTREGETDPTVEEDGLWESFGPKLLNSILKEPDRSILDYLENLRQGR